VAGIGTGVHVEDLQNTLTHEFGTCSAWITTASWGQHGKRGVDQNGVLVPECERASQEIQDATMFAAVAPGDTLRRTLTDDDIAGGVRDLPGGQRDQLRGRRRRRPGRGLLLGAARGSPRRWCWPGCSSVREPAVGAGDAAELDAHPLQRGLALGQAGRHLEDLLDRP
jgi:hypothetical protein